MRCRSWGARVCSHAKGEYRERSPACGGTDNKMNTWLLIVAIVAAAWICAYRRYSAPGWTAVIGVGLAALTFSANISPPLLVALWIAFTAGAIFLNPSPLRRATVSAFM